MGSPRLSRSQLANILASPEFVSTERLSRFLGFVVDKVQSVEAD